MNIGHDDVLQRVAEISPALAGNARACDATRQLVPESMRLMVDAGLIVMVSFISPFRSERRMARGLVEAGEFIEVFVDTPISVAEARDPKGLYAKAKAGRPKHFVFAFRPPTKQFNLKLSFAKSRVSRDEVIEALENILRELRKK